MFSTMSPHMKKAAVILMLVIALAQPLSMPVVAHAQWVVTVVGDVSPTGLQNFLNHLMTHLKDFILDHLATLVAKQILHQLTASIINWINTGFQGSPAFITNPGSFFLNAADQVTGSFLATEGPLSRLCSPFSIDVRLSLALNQAFGPNAQYTCTFNTIAGNLTGNGFLNGNFSQGGWPAFSALTTQPQNNYMGSYLQAQSQLNTMIASRQNNIRADLQMGGGFMSYENCKDVTADTAASVNNSEGGVLGLTSDQRDQLNSVAQTQIGVDKFGNPSTIQKHIDPKTGEFTFQSCQTQTPGSAIASTLFTSINSPQVELELANDINAVINALVTQLVSMMLSQGLNALSGGGGGGGHTSYTNQVIQDAISAKSQNSQEAYGRLNSAANPGYKALVDAKSNYDSAVATVTDSRNRFQTARACFTGKDPLGANAAIKRSYQQSQIAAIDSFVSIRIDPLLAQLTAKQAQAGAELAGNASSTTATNANAGTAQEVQQLNDNLNNIISSQTRAATDSIAKTTASEQVLKDAQTQAGQFNTEAARFQSACDAFPNWPAMTN